MTGKVRSIVEHMDEIDGMINQASKNWKTTRMAKAELPFCVLLHMRSSMRMIFRYLYPLMRQLNWQNYTDQIMDRIRKRNLIRNGMKQRNALFRRTDKHVYPQYVCSGFYDESCCGTWGSV